LAEPREPRARPALRLLGFARPYAWLVAATIAFSLLYGAGMTGRVFILKGLVDDVAIENARVESLRDVAEMKAAKDVDKKKLSAERRQLKRKVRENLWRLVFWGGVLVLVMPIVRFGRDYVSEWVMTRVLVDMQSELANKLLRLPLGRHQRETRGDAIARLTSDTSLANKMQSLVFGDFLEDLGVVVTALVAAFLLSWQLSLVLLAIGPPVAVVLSVFGRRIRKASRRRQEQVSEVMQRLVQILSGIKVIKAFGAEKTESEAFGDELMRYFRRAMKVVKNRAYSRSLVELASQAVMIVVVALGIWAVVGEFWGLTLGTMLAFAFVSGSLYRPMKALTQVWNAIHDATPAAERIFEVLDAPAEVADLPDARPIERLEQGIRFRDVTFHYGREEVLQRLDLEIPAGRTVALVGPTGSGKTTIADLLLRFHDPESGAVEFDGVDARRLERQSLRALCAVVTQDPFLFDATIEENIRYGRPEASLAELRVAAEAAHALEFIEKLPQGFATPLGARGVRLSGGQRQRIAIARAILRDPALLLLDEATSALDAESERLVQAALDRLMAGRTTLVIAHRLATVLKADRILVLDQGRIVESGRHEELVRAGGLYARLAALQFSDVRGQMPEDRGGLASVI
jgi:ABC-type multidrug transport system fused ATPase/permease subunit